jgi:outer membrane protein OmpA-like peptidoglycan-associated protein
MIALMLFGAAAQPLNAQSNDSTRFTPSLFDLDPFGGYQFYHGGRIQDMQNGVLGGIRFTWDFHKYFGLETGVTYGKDDVKLIPAVNFPNSVVRFDANSWQLAVNPVLNFTPRGSRLRPFVTAGPASMWFRPHSQGINVPLAGGGTYTYGLIPRVEPALIYGGGLKIRLSDIIGVRFDVRGLWTKASHFGLPSAPQGPLGLYSPRTFTDDALQFTAGLMIHLGKKKPPPPLPETTVTTIPGGLAVVVDGASYTAPKMFTWAPGTSHTINVASPQTQGTSTYLFDNWSDNGAQSHTVQAGATSMTYTAQFRLQQQAPEFEITAIVGAHDVCPGDTVELRATTRGVPADATYSWSGPGVSGSGSMATVATGSLSGSQTVTLTITAGAVTRTASATFRVLGGGPPTVDFPQPQSPISQGQKVTLNATATADGNCGNATVTYTASEGSISGNVYDSSTVSFDPRASRLQEKTITITATGTDSRGNKATATRTIVVTRIPNPIHWDLLFGKGSARVNNCYKRILLEELTPLLKEYPDSNVVLIGHRDSDEKGAAAAKLDRMRVLNAAAILSAGAGICPQLDLSRIKVKWVGTDQSSELKGAFCPDSVKERGNGAILESDEHAKYRRVEVWFIPNGATVPPVAGDAQAAPETDIKKLHCPK